LEDVGKDSRKLRNEEFDCMCIGMGCGVTGYGMDGSVELYGREEQYGKWR
jgi:hypothetical protein